MYIYVCIYECILDVHVLLFFLFLLVFLRRLRPEIHTNFLVIIWGFLSPPLIWAVQAVSSCSLSVRMCSAKLLICSLQESEQEYLYKIIPFLTPRKEIKKDAQLTHKYLLNMVATDSSLKQLSRQPTCEICRRISEWAHLKIKQHFWKKFTASKWKWWWRF